ncbi:phosphatase PAP2 family protein [Cryptosporangium sp. NPDC048952]|uniref:phosphatase PAP2 family protein n=1 Tax=Cryptosporangium sp. NPDC048952 TaxID=3363961 RepID=UPI00371D58B6
MILEDTATQPPAPETPSRFRELLATRRVSVPLFAVAFALWWFFVGLPTDPILAALWLWFGTIAFRPDQPWRYHLGFARDWIPIVLLLVAYDFSRGLADNGVAPHVTEMIHADEWLTGGVIPTVWAQEHLYDPNQIHWYDVLASFVYFSHFVVCLTIAAVLWFRSRPLWGAFMRRWFTLTAAGLVTYFVYPAAPPWWASEHGYIAAEVMRMSGRGWEAIGLHGGSKMLAVGQSMSNPVAAMPSLHSAFAMCAVAFFLTRVKKRWIPLLLAYPVLMSLTLVYTGEHYIIDAIVGYAYVGIVYLVVWLGERWWAQRQAGEAAESLLRAAAPPTAAASDASSAGASSAGASSAEVGAAPAVPPTAVPPTAVPSAAEVGAAPAVPPTAVPPTAVPPTAVPPTAVPSAAEVGAALAEERAASEPTPDRASRD